jgi:catechol 2,3-dioxygenase-like lactoylglutathione lyase family enzyme
MLLTRRKAIHSLGAAALAGWLQAAEGDRLRFTGLDHAQFEVPDGAAAAKFYGRVFGGPVWKHREAARWYVTLGRSYLVLEESKERAGKIDHLSLGVAGLEMDAVHRYLDGQGIAYKDFPSGRDVLLTGPDGPGLELSPENSWKALENQSVQKAGEIAPGEGLFRPAFLRSAVIGVKNSEPLRNFCRKLLGEDSSPVTKSLFDVGESQIDIRVSIAGQMSSESRIGVRVARFDVGEMQDPLLEAGAQIELAHTPPFITFRDMNGFLVDVTG